MLNSPLRDERVSVSCGNMSRTRWKQRGIANILFLNPLGLPFLSRTTPLSPSRCRCRCRWSSPCPCWMFEVIRTWWVSKASGNSSFCGAICPSLRKRCHGLIYQPVCSDLRVHRPIPKHASTHPLPRARSHDPFITRCTIQDKMLIDQLGDGSSE
jgi:hypothetical protein